MADEPKATDQSAQLPPIIERTRELIIDECISGVMAELQISYIRGIFDESVTNLVEIIADGIVKKDPTAPITDPASPNFDIEAYKRELNAAGGTTALYNALKPDIDAAQEAACELFNASIAVKEAEKLLSYPRGTILNALNVVNEIKAAAHFVDHIKTAAQCSDMLKAIAENLKILTNYDAVADALRLVASIDYKAAAETAQKRLDYLKELEPFIEKELTAARKKSSSGELDEITADYILKHDITLTGKPRKDGKHKDIVERAIKAHAAAKEKDGVQAITAKSVEHLEYPLDKINAQIWRLIDESTKDFTGQLRFNTQKKGSDIESYICFSINFDALQDAKITKKLTQFDKRVYMAAAGIYAAGNAITTTTQIYKAMGYKGMPGATDREKINNSLTKMRHADIYIDNSVEANALKGYKKQVYDGALLPFDRITEEITINGKTTENWIRFRGEPPLIDFARRRKQITTIPRILIESPISKTEKNLSIEDYLIERIGRMKNSSNNSTPKKILYATIFEKCGITDKKQKQRAPGTVKRILDHHKSCNWISGYKESQDGITVIL